jgi:AGZA family xanthine/uracil permease-like MFS transporter
VDRFFKITERGSTISQEIRGGFVTFFTMAYIIVLNPLIIGFAKDADGKYVTGSAPDLPMIAAATALVWSRTSRSRSLPASGSTPSWPSRSHPA